MRSSLRPRRAAASPGARSPGRANGRTRRSPARTTGAPGRDARPTPSLEAFYERDGDAFVPSELTRGPWDPGAQHAGPPSALLGRAVERDGWLVGRITIEVLRPVPLRPLTVAHELVRPGRNVELVAAVLSAAGSDPRPIARAIAWRLKIDDGVDPLADEPPPPGPEAGRETPFFPTGEAVGYHTAMEY